MTDCTVKKQQGYECYDWYHYLWHLIAIGAVRAVSGSDAKYEIEPDGWTRLEHLAEGQLPGDGERVAQIDVGVNDRHPNLPRIKETVDFAVHPFGATYAPTPDLIDAPPNALAQANVDVDVTRGLETRQANSLISAATWNWARAIADLPEEDDLLDRLEAGRGVRHQEPVITRERYSGHGTACAGLIVGAPPQETGDGNGEGGGNGDDECCDVEDESIPYWGVAPGAQLLPIVVSAQPTAEQLIFAFLYARDGPVDRDEAVSVIHFPREAADPARAHRHRPGYGDTRYATDPNNIMAWTLFEKIFDAVSQEIPVVCAAGNDGYDHLIYPASKADDANGIISVGAVTYRAKRSAYSNYCSAGAACTVTISAPSDDQQVYTRHQVRLDREAAGWRDHNFTVHTAANGSLAVDYSPEALVTTDVPGPRGYVDGKLEGLSAPERENEDSAALYTLFGGTSGASAIVAGAIALLQSKERAANNAPLDGLAVKNKVKTSGRTNVDWPWLAGPVAIATDTPNGEAAMPVDQQFGDGVININDLLGP